MEMFITFEGIDGSGKSTQAKRLAERIGKDFSVLLTWEPGYTHIGETIRSILLNKDMDIRTEFLLFASDRNEHFQKVIMPNIKKEVIVISDRFADSSVAYQGYGRGLDIDFINYVHNSITNGKKPDVTFLIDVSPEAGIARLKKFDRIEQEGIIFLQKVREGYLKIASQDARYEVINGEKSVDEIGEEIWNRFLKRREEWIKQKR
jgi:dTMP kinase